MPRPEPGLLDLIADCERLGFELGIWHEWERRGDGKKTGNIIEHLYCFHRADPRRRPPDRILLPLMARARVVRGYLRRVRSPSFDGDRRTALASSEADDRRLREHGR